jgi:hypothetical protein
VAASPATGSAVRLRRASTAAAWWIAARGATLAGMIVRYRLRMRLITRILRTTLLGFLGLMFVPAVITNGVDTQWRVLSIVGLASSIYGLRIVLGPAVEVRPNGLRVLKSWPWRRDIPWYRIYEIEVVPGYWVLDLELNSGEQLQLPCVEHVDDLYERIELHRSRLDA